MCVAMPGRIVELDDDFRFAEVDISGKRQKINLALVKHENIQPGDWVLVHVGHAVSKVTEAYAQEQLALLEALAELENGADDGMAEWFYDQGEER